MARVLKKCGTCGIRKKVAEDKDSCSKCGGSLGVVERVTRKKSERNGQHSVLPRFRQGQLRYAGS